MGLEKLLVGSTIKVASYLEKTKCSSPKTISEETDLAPRTVTFALKRLMKGKVVRRIPNLGDMRSPLYAINEETWKEIVRTYPHKIIGFDPLYHETGIYREFIK